MSDEVMRAIGKLEERTVGIKATLDELRDTMRAHHEMEHDVLAGQGGRIRSLERSRTWLLGAAAGLGAGFSYLTKWIVT